MLPDLEKLRALHAADPQVAQVLGTAGHHRVRDGVSVLASLLRKMDRTRASAVLHEPVVAAFRRIEQCGFGRLLQPTVRHRARFVWAAHPHTVLQALGEKDFVLQPGHLLGQGGAAAELAAALAQRTAASTPPAPQPAEAAHLPAQPAHPPAQSAHWQRHVFNLRPGLEIHLTLPADLTLPEAERLAHLLRASVHQP